MAGSDDGSGSPITGIDEALSGALGEGPLFAANDGSPPGLVGGLEFLGGARGGEAVDEAIGGHALLVAAPCSVGGGTSEIGGATDWPLALPSSHTPADSKPRAVRVARLIRVLQTALVEIDCMTASLS